MATVVSLTFDDALDSHLDHAVPILERAGLRGTFFANISSECLSRRADEWRRAAERGHELGNHSLLHPAVASKEWVREGNALEGYTLDRMHMELEVASNVLRMLDGRSERTFAYPCGNTVLGRAGWLRRALVALRLDRTRIMGFVDRFGLDLGDLREDFQGIVRDLFVAARRGGIESPLESYENTDRHSVPTYCGDGRTCDELVRFVDLAVGVSPWLVISFHGIGGGHGLTCSVPAFQRLVERAASDSEIVSATFMEGALRQWPSSGEDAANEKED